MGTTEAQSKRPPPSLAPLPQSREMDRARKSGTAAHPMKCVLFCLRGHGWPCIFKICDRVSCIFEVGAHQGHINRCKLLRTNTDMLTLTRNSKCIGYKLACVSTHPIIRLHMDIRLHVKNKPQTTRLLKTTLAVRYKCQERECHSVPTTLPRLPVGRARRNL